MDINTSAIVVTWLSIWGPSVLLAIIALFTPYFAMRIRHWYLRPQLDVEFKYEPPYFRLFPTNTGRLVYYVRFAVINNGKTQANDCEAVLEKVYWVEDLKNIRKWIFLPVNLKWSGEDPVRDFETACFRTIYPGGRKTFCDIGHIEENKDGFSFELPRRFLEQSDILAPGDFKIQISVYAKNAEKVTREFKISWSGVWKNTEEEMSEEIIIKML